MSNVSLHEVNKHYGAGAHAVHAVKDVSFSVADGEFLSVVGPSGCGKSTTLRMIVGLETPSSGEIRFDDRRVNELPPQQRNVAMAFENYALYPNFTARENIAFPLEVRKVPKAERQKKVDALAELLQIEHILHMHPYALSGGQRQRVSLARALIREPAAFILDEVLGHVDGHLRFQMLFDLKRLHQSLGSTMIFVTHDQMEALALSDRIAVMYQGNVKQVGTRDELYERPVDRFVADFIGEPPTNFFSATLTELDGALAMTTGALTFRLSERKQAALRGRNDARYLIGIRPQNLHRQPKNGMVPIQARVEINEYLGERSILTLKTGERRLQALSSPDDRVAAGETVDLHYEPRDVMVFSEEDERLIV
ncbi:MAG: ABC transporter ATP-binding protein [Alphaproteobacteria bacterium]